MSLLLINDLQYTYYTKTGNVLALSDVTISIEKNEFVCVCGTSGCGKSTFLDLIAGFLEPTGGEILLNGNPIKNISFNRGMVFQQPTLFEWLNVRDNVSFGLKMRGLSKDEIKKRTNDILSRVGLAEFAEKFVYELSGGMQQRVGIARILVNDPEIILMDEPFGALDALTREKMQDFLRNLWRDMKKTVIFVTHDVDEALLIGTRVIVLSPRPGTIIKDMDVGFSKEIIDHHSDSCRYTEGYFRMREEILSYIKKE